MNFIRSLLGLVTAAGITLGGVATASSAELLSDERLTPTSQWEFEYRPNAWIPFMSGDSTLGTNSTGISTDIFSILAEVDHIYACMSYQEARIGRLGLFADVFWTDVGFGLSGVRNGNPIAGLDKTILADADVSFEMAILEPGIAYEIGRRSNGGGSFKDPQSASSTALDVIAGGRYWYLKPDVDLDVTASVNIPALGITRTGAGNISASKTFDWWDPFIGLRVRHKRASGNELMIKADVGGFGVGSDLAWQVAAGYNYNTRLFGHDLTSYLGYRALHIDYEQGSGTRKFGLDLLIHGPVLGLSLKW